MRPVLLPILVALALAAPALALPLPDEPQDDAGTGQDAGDTLVTATPVEPGIVYHGRIAGYAFGDSQDTYRFDADAGDVLDFEGASLEMCFYVWGEERGAGDYLAYSCSLGGVAYTCCAWDPPIATVGTDVGFTVTLPKTMTYYFVIGWDNGNRVEYDFSFALDAAAPELRTLPPLT